MKKTNKILFLLVALVMVLTVVLAACQTHICGHKCPDCGKCTDADCKDPVCADKCPGNHEGPGPVDDDPVYEVPALDPDDGEEGTGFDPLDPSKYPEDLSDSDKEYLAIYREVFSDFYTAYAAAKAETNVSKRQALMAVAEAKLLETNAFSFTNANGGNYAIARVVPHTVTNVRWGSDSDRLHQMLVATTLIKSTDRAAINAAWASMKEGTNPDDNTTGHKYSGADFNAWAKKYMEAHGYTIKTEYRMAYGTENKSWDVLNTSEQTDSEVLVNTYDGLVEYDEFGVIQPALATSWTQKTNANGTESYSFKIRKGVKWVDSQGREVGEVTADDFVAGFQHMLDAQGGLEWLVQGLVVGASAYIAGTETDFTKVGCRATSKYTVEFVLNAETPYFLTMLGYSVFAPMNRDYYVAHGGVFGVAEFEEASAEETYTYAKDQNNIAYCGPYLITSYTSGNSMELTANASYWNKDNINLTKIVRLYDDGQVATRGYDNAKSGVYDGASLSSATLPTAKTEKLGNDAESIFDTYHYVSGVDSTSFMVAYNLDRKAFANWNSTDLIMASTQTDVEKTRANAALNNQNFRQALTFAFDRVTYRTARTGSADIAANSLVNSYTPGDFVSLTESVTIKINGTDKTFAAGTMYGEIMQAQLDADNAGVTVWKEVDGEWKSNGFDGWYNPTKAAEKIALAVQELQAQGIEITTANPLVLDVPTGSFYAPFEAQGQSYKQMIEENLGGLVKINLVEATEQRHLNYATYYVNWGKDVNYDVSTGWTGWGPDFGDPCTFLDTMLPMGEGYMTKLLGLW